MLTIFIQICTLPYTTDFIRSYHRLIGIGLKRSRKPDYKVMIKQITYSEMNFIFYRNIILITILRTLVRKSRFISVNVSIKECSDMSYNFFIKSYFLKFQINDKLRPFEVLISCLNLANKCIENMMLNQPKISSDHESSVVIFH